MKAELIASVVVLSSLILLAIISSLIGSKPAKQTSEALKIFAEECKRLTLEAEQDKNPIIALVHSTEAMVWAKAVGYMSSDMNIQRSTGEDAKKLEKLARQAQSTAIHRLKSSN